LIRIDGASYLNEYCSLMFFMHVFKMFFYKTEKTCFYVFYLQINVFNIYDFWDSLTTPTATFHEVLMSRYVQNLKFVAVAYPFLRL